MTIDDELIGLTQFSPEEEAHLRSPAISSGKVIRGPARTLVEIEEYCIRAGITRAGNQVPRENSDD